MNRRELKGHSLYQVGSQLGIPMKVVQGYEQKKFTVLDFYTWVSLASYYGREVLAVPFTVHRLEQSVADVYFRYIANGEPVQYSAKMACQYRRGVDVE